VSDGGRDVELLRCNSPSDVLDSIAAVRDYSTCAGHSQSMVCRSTQPRTCTRLFKSLSYPGPLESGDSD
jgi:hypothetical protein